MFFEGAVSCMALRYILISFRIYSLLFAMERNASDKKLLVNDKITSL